MNAIAKIIVSVFAAGTLGGGVLGAAGCTLTYDPWDWPTWIDNWAPDVTDASAGCFWDTHDNRYYWYFDAAVDDLDGLGDIVSVEANVYDDWRGGRWVDGFALDPTTDAWDWYTEVPEAATRLDCHYHGYTVEFVVWDYYDDTGTLSVYPDVF